MADELPAEPQTPADLIAPADSPGIGGRLFDAVSDLGTTAADAVGQPAAGSTWAGQDLGSHVDGPYNPDDPDSTPPTERWRPSMAAGIGQHHQPAARPAAAPQLPAAPSGAFDTGDSTEGAGGPSTAPTAPATPDAPNPFDVITSTTAAINKANQDASETPEVLEARRQMANNYLDAASEIRKTSAESVARQSQFNTQFGAGLQDLSQWRYDPNFRYKDSDGNFTPGGVAAKILTSLGLAIGTTGAAVSGSPNASLAIFQQQADNDLKAQLAGRENQVQALQLMQKHNLDFQDFQKLHLASVLDQTKALNDYQATLADNATAKFKVKANAAALEHADAVTQSELLSKRAMMGFEGWKFSQTEQDKALERQQRGQELQLKEDELTNPKPDQSIMEAGYRDRTYLLQKLSGLITGMGDGAGGFIKNAAEGAWNEVAQKSGVGAYDNLPGNIRKSALQYVQAKARSHGIHRNINDAENISEARELFPAGGSPTAIRQGLADEWENLPQEHAHFLGSSIAHYPREVQQPSGGGGFDPASDFTPSK